MWTTLTTPSLVAFARRCRLGGAAIACGLAGAASIAQPHPGSAEAEVAEDVWATFATELSEASGLPYTADGLRHLLPTTQTADVGWTQSYSRIASSGIASSTIADVTGMTALELLNTVELQLFFKTIADIEGAEFGRPLRPKETGWAELNDALWSRYAADLADVQHVREAAPDVSAEDLLWVLTARDYDRTMLEQGFSAEEILRMPAYQLSRKIAVDALVRSMVSCVRCADPSASYYRTACITLGVERDVCVASYDIALRGCDFADAACRANPVARRGCGVLFKTCLCIADCRKCTCLNGTTPNGCRNGCSFDLEHDCVEPDPPDGTYGVWSN